ncbi:hypothetical protein D3C75_663280 [compost metagenome]
MLDYALDAVEFIQLCTPLEERSDPPPVRSAVNNVIIDIQFIKIALRQIHGYGDSVKLLHCNRTMSLDHIAECTGIHSRARGKF